MNKWRSRIFWVLVISLFLFPTVVLGHAYVDQSNPTQESESKEAPKEIRVTFSEKINTKLSSLSLKDETGKKISGTLNGENDITLIFTPSAALSPGVYKVEWQILSLDTHVTEGSFRFAVETTLPKIRPAETKSLDEATEEPVPVPSPPVPAVKETKSTDKRKTTSVIPVINKTMAETAVDNKAENPIQSTTPVSQEKKQPYLQATKAANDGTKSPAEQQVAQAKSAEIKKTVREIDVSQHQNHAQSHPKTRDHQAEHSSIDSWLRTIQVMVGFLVGGVIVNRILFTKRLTSGVEQIVYGCAGIFFLGTGFVQLVILAQKLIGNGTFTERLLDLMTTSNVAWMLWIRLLLLCVLVVLSFFPNKKQDVLLASILIGLVSTYTFTGHTYSGDTFGGIPFLSHMIHFLAGIIWVSGLVGLLYLSATLPKTEEMIEYLHQQVKRFSFIALIFIGLVSFSGVVLSVLGVKEWRNLVSTDYGLILIVKIAFFILALFVAGCHRFYFLPKLRTLVTQEESLKTTLIHRMFTFLRIELALATLVVVLAGILSSSPLP